MAVRDVVDQVRGWLAVPGHRAELRAALLVAAVAAGLGIPVGLLWEAISPHERVGIAWDGRLVYADPDSEATIAADGWFVILGVVTGVLLAVGAWLLARRYRGPAVLVALAAGSVLGSWLAWQVGGHLGQAAFREALVKTGAGKAFDAPVDLRSAGAVWLQGFVAVFGYTLLAGWSRYASLRRPEPLADQDQPDDQPVGVAPESP